MLPLDVGALESRADEGEAYRREGQNRRMAQKKKKRDQGMLLLLH